MFNPETANSGASGGVYLPSIEAAARTQNIEFIVAPVREPPDIDAVLEEISKRSGGGLLVMPNTFTIAQRKRIVRRRPVGTSPRSIPFQQQSRREGCCPTPSMWSIYSGEQQPMLIAFSRARLRANCLYSSQPNSSFQLISRPPKRLISPCRTRCWSAPTRSLNETAGVHRGTGIPATAGTFSRHAHERPRSSSLSNRFQLRGLTP
jgi:hypothetical protein